MAVQVSVCVLAYNHERYVAQCLDSILSQRTSFDYEVLVRDDASTDGTVAVLREYERRYPGKVRLVLEEHNTWNDPAYTPVFGRVFAPLAKGRYLATCEGDDYWICDTKLQRQFDYMEGHPACGLCGHAVRIVRDGAGKADGGGLLTCGPVERDGGGLLTCGSAERDITCDEVMERWASTTHDGIWSVHPSSCFSRIEVDRAYARDWQLGASAGDYIRLCYFSHASLVHFMPDTMSAYRYMAAQSWTASAENDAEVLAEHHRGYIQTMHTIDALTNREHHDAAMRGCRQRAMLLAGMTDGMRFFKSEVGAPIAPYLRPGDYATLAALRALNAVGLRPMRNTATGRVRLVRVGR
jgi:hypothetical protein